MAAYQVPRLPIPVQGIVRMCRITTLASPDQCRNIPKFLTGRRQLEQLAHPTSPPFRIIPVNPSRPINRFSQFSGGHDSVRDHERILPLQYIGASDPLALGGFLFSLLLATGHKIDTGHDTESHPHCCNQTVCAFVHHSFHFPIVRRYASARCPAVARIKSMS